MYTIRGLLRLFIKKKILMIFKTLQNLHVSVYIFDVIQMPLWTKQK